MNLLYFPHLVYIARFIYVYQHIFMKHLLKKTIEKILKKIRDNIYVH